MPTITIDEKREILEAVIEKMDECAELLRSLDDRRIDAYCLAAFEGCEGGWLGKFERDIIAETLAAIDADEDDASIIPHLPQGGRPQRPSSRS